MNYEFIYRLIGLACLAVTWIKFDPIQSQIKRLLDLSGTFWHQLYSMLSCAKCVGFWAAMFVTGDLIQASVVAVLASYLTYLTSRL